MAEEEERRRMILEEEEKKRRRREAAATRAAHKRAVELERARRPIVVVAEDTSLAELARRHKE